MLQLESPVTFPNETAAYREARNRLLTAERELRRSIEAVAALRRGLPPGGEVPADYVFAGENGPVRMSELFSVGNTLLLYSYMFGPKMEKPCPNCTSIVEGLDRAAPHVARRANLAVVARSPIARIAGFARTRGWNQIQLLSSADNTYHADYHGEKGDDQQPIMNVFVRRDGKIHHFWASELMFTPSDPGQDPRHVDLFWPLWHLLDITPEGRGDFYPRLSD